MAAASPADAASGGRTIEIGRSREGRAIVAHEFGSGPIWLALIGGLHQGAESNTTELTGRLRAWLAANPTELPPDVGLALIPLANPDGAVAGDRHNAAGVDLNRNWDDGWQPHTFGPTGPVRQGGGAYPFSEPETRALRDYALDRGVTAAMFFHSQGGVVVSPRSDGPAAELAQRVAQASSYLYLAKWTAYPVSGEAAGYLARLGVFALDVELSTHDSPEFDRNLRGVRAALDWLQRNVSRRLFGPGSYEPVN